MKYIILFLLVALNAFFSNAQNIAITDDDSYTANPSAMLDVKSTSKGILLPRLTTAQRMAVINPATGLLVFDDTEKQYYFYNGTAWVNVSSGGTDANWNKNGENVFLTDPTNNVGIGTSTPENKLIVKGDSNTGVNDAIFAVVSPDGDTLFAVYKYGTRVYIYDDPSVKSSGNKGGFAVGGFTPSKNDVTNEYLRVTPDSVRIYIEENPANKVSGNKGGFAVGGFTPSKSGLINDYLSVNSDSISVSKSLYIPRMTTDERENLGFIPSDALIIFNTSDECMQIYKNEVWSNIWCFNCAPAFIIQPVNQTICSETNTNFFVSLTGTNLVYQWQVSTNGGSDWSDISNNSIYSGATSWSLSLTNVPVSFNNYKYRCNVTSACPPGVTSNVVTLYVGSAPPVVTTPPENQVLSVGCTADFSIISPGYGVTYQWQVSADGGNTWSIISNGGTNPTYSNATTSVFSITNAPLSYNNYKYLCVVGNTCGVNATSTDATLTVSPAPTITTHPSDLLLPNSHTAIFTVEVSGSGMLYQWQRSTDGGSTWSNISNGGTIPTYSNATTASISITDVPISFNTNKFRCIVSHYCRPSVTSNAATLTISLPTIATIEVSNITSTTAMSGGNITIDGGATVIASGICWSTSPNPVVTDNHTTDGAVMGSFTSSITGLTLGLTYYVRAYATNGIGTAYGNEISFTTVLAIGENYQGGIIAYLLQAGDPGYIAGQTHGLIVAPSDQSTGAEWGSYGTAISGADGTAIGTGNQNTIDIMADCATASIAARLCGDLIIDIYSDWYLPSKDELNMLYLNKDAVGGFVNNSYWSSSEFAEYCSWSQNFGSGTQDKYANKNVTYYVRAVRAF